MFIKNFINFMFGKKTKLNLEEYSKNRIDFARAISNIISNYSTSSINTINSESSKDIKRFFNLVEYFVNSKKKKNIQVVNINLWKSNSLKSPLLSIWNSIISNKIGKKILANRNINVAMERISVNSSIGEYVLGDIYTEGELIMRDLESNKLKQKINKYFEKKLKNKKIIVFINAIELKETKYINSVLEELKLFFDVNGFCFLVGINENSLIKDGYNIEQFINHKITLADEKTLDIAEMLWTEHSLDLDPSLSHEKAKFIKIISKHDLTKQKVVKIISEIKIISAYYNFSYFDKFIVLSVLLYNLNPELYTKTYKSPGSFLSFVEYIIDKKVTSSKVSNFSVYEFNLFIDVYLMTLTKSKFIELQKEQDPESYKLRLINEYKELEDLVCHDTNIFNLIAKDIRKLKLLKLID